MQARHTRFVRPSAWHSARPASLLSSLLRVAPRCAYAAILGCLTAAPVAAEQTLTLAVRAGAPAYYTEDSRALGVDHDIAKLLAQHPDIELKVVAVKTVVEALDMVRNGKADLAAGYLALPSATHTGMRALPAYATVTHQLAYYYSEPPPADLSQIPCNRLEVSNHPAHNLALRKALETTLAENAPCPTLTPLMHADVNSREMLRLLDQGFVGYALVDSSDVIIRHYQYPRLKIAFDLPESIPVAWLAGDRLPRTLFDELTDFFNEINNNETTKRLHERYFQHTTPLEYGSKLTFIQKANTVLKKHSPDFINTANLLGMDWRLLVALSYQESHWNAKAVSPSLAKGLMMLTVPIARQYGVKNRFNAAANITAGARYFISLKNRLPPTLEEPDRTWFALAAYNIGMRYVLNARTLALKAGKNPDWWMHVREFFPIARKDSDAPVRFGAQKYVQRILLYRDLIRWLDQQLILFPTGP